MLSVFKLWVPREFPNHSVARQVALPNPSHTKHFHHQNIRARADHLWRLGRQQRRLESGNKTGISR